MSAAFRRCGRGQSGDLYGDYISSIPDQGTRTAPQALHAVRRRWSIENQLHWVLNIAFREDECCVRKDHGDENLAALRQIALNCLRRDNANTDKNFGMVVK